MARKPKLKLEKPAPKVPPAMQKPEQRIPNIESIKEFFGFESCILVGRRNGNIVTWMSQMSAVEALGIMVLSMETVTSRNTVLPVNPQ